MENFDITQILELIGQLGFASVFLWLFVREMNSHERTREEYRRDLREIAGMRAEERLLQEGTQPRRPVDLNANGNRP